MEQNKLNPKIAIVSESFYSCGVRVVIKQCEEIITNHGWSIPVLVGPKIKGTNYSNYISLPSKAVSKKRNYFRTLFFSPIKTQKVLRDIFTKTDIVHIHSISLLSIRSIFLLNKINRNRENKIKVIFHIHTQFEQYLKTWYGILGVPMAKIVGFFINFCIRSSDLVIFPTEFYRNMYTKKSKIVTKQKVWCAPISVKTKTDFYLSDLSKMIGNKSLADKKILVYVGRLGNEKNINKLFDFFQRLSILSDDFLLLLIGTGEIDYFLKQISSLPKEARSAIILLGQHPKNKVLQINKMAYAGISLSITEVQGLAVLEQMACGMPVIVPEDTCWESWVKESGGGIVTRRDLSNFSEAYKFLLDKDKCKIAGKKSKEYVEKKFSGEVLNKELINIYKDVLT